MILALAGCFFSGALIVVILVWLLMPKLMLKTRQSNYGVEETCEKLESAALALGWNVPSIRNLNQMVGKEGLSLNGKVRIVELCNAVYAKSVLDSDPEMSTLMPCALGVYEKNGRTFVTSMNVGLMGRMFGGNVAKVMGGSVSSEEGKILECLK